MGKWFAWLGIGAACAACCAPLWLPALLGAGGAGVLLSAWRTELAIVAGLALIALAGALFLRWRIRAREAAHCSIDCGRGADAAQRAKQRRP